jgi:hypothetical protein
MYFVLILIVATLTALLPWLAPRVAKKYGYPARSAPTWLPIVAAVVYMTALYLPDVHISPDTNTFQQHFLGGGVFTAMLYIYFLKLFDVRLRWPIALFGLFAWASALGVLNELLEFVLNELELTRINTADTDWDLFANTMGAMIAFIVWQFIERFTYSKNSRG